MVRYKYAVYVYEKEGSKIRWKKIGEYETPERAEEKRAKLRKIWNKGSRVIALLTGEDEDADIRIS
jgi:hypothetical protein